VSFLFRVITYEHIPQPNTPVLCGLQSPKRFEEVFEEMICFMEQTDHWENTEVELSARGVRDLILIQIQDLSWKYIFKHTIFIKKVFYVLFSLQVKHLNFYDIVLDFILMDSFEDLENPPVSIQNVVNNRWLNNSFKETVCTEFLTFDQFQLHNYMS